MTLAILLDTPAVRHTLAALPDDPRLAELRAAFVAREERLADARARPVAIDARIRAIDAALIDADAKAQRALLTERGLLREERDSLPARLLAESRRYAAAELALLGHLAATIRPLGEAAAAELAPIEGAANHTNARISNIEGARLDAAEKRARIAACRAELHEAAPQARALNERIRLVEQALSMIVAHVRDRYGERIVATNPHTHAEAGEAFGRRVVRQFRGA